MDSNTDICRVPLLASNLCRCRFSAQSTLAAVGDRLAHIVEKHTDGVVSAFLATYHPLTILVYSDNSN